MVYRKYIWIFNGNLLNNVREHAGLRSKDPHLFLADPDPAVFLNADPDPAAFSMRIWIRFNKLCKEYADLDLGEKMNADPCGSESPALGFCIPSKMPSIST